MPVSDTLAAAATVQRRPSPVGNAVSLIGVIWVGGASKISRAVALLPITAFALFQILSTLWSLEPSVSIKYSLELFYTAIVGLMFAIYSKPEGIVRAVLFGGGAAVLLSLATGKQGPSVDGPVLIGVLGSKNAMGEMSQLVFQCALGVLAMPRQDGGTRLAALLIAGPAFFVAVTVHTSTAIIALVGASLTLGVLLVVSRTSIGVRIALIVFLIIVSLLCYMVWDDIAAIMAEFSLRVLKKDSTLTGRTVLWEFARNFISERPLLGRGYKEVWLGHSADTVGLLHWAGVDDGRTFYFHETYLDAAVDSGICGAAILAVTFLYLLARAALRVLFRPGVGWIVIFTLAATFIIESFFDNIIQPLSLVTVLIFAMSASLSLGSAPPTSRRRSAQVPRRG